MNDATRTWLFAGVLACGLVWLFPFREIGLSEFAIHMLRHMTLVAVAAPCLVLGLPALRQWLPAMPVLASFAEFIVIWAWHLPDAQILASSRGWGLVAEQACFLSVGILLWASVLDPLRRLAGAGALLLTSMHMTLLGALIILSPRPLYLCSTGVGSTLSLPSALEAQQIGGVIMLAIGTPIYLIAGLWLVYRALAITRDEATRGGALS